MANQIKPEIWKTIEGFPAYAVSNYGQVKRIVKGLRHNAIAGHILTPCKGVRGYFHVRLCGPNHKPKILSIHKLVLETFDKPKPINFQCNHIDGIKTNNHIDNLEWVSCPVNIHHAYKTGLNRQYGKTHTNAKLSENQVHQIRKLYATNKHSLTQLGRQFNVTAQNVRCIVLRKSWVFI